MPAASVLQAAALFDVRGLAVLVTGAASGIGLGYAEIMAAHGAHVTLTDSNPQALETALAALRITGGKVHGVVADVTRPDTLHAAVADVLQREGKLDVLFANAGISAGPGFMKGDGTRNHAAAIENLSLDTFDRALAVNLRGALATIQAAVPPMKRQRSGRIIVTTTVSLLQTETLVSTLYVASKAALGQLVRQAALELAAYGILVNGIAPGPTITGIGGGRLQDAAARLPFEQMNPLHRLATPADLHGAALYLASRASAYVTGTQLVVDGGACLGRAD
jgi:NAD(P)-dependent dehydrogenase (short-subunit alcohol dehydrogenase family)